MNVERVVAELQETYPQANILLLPKTQPREIVCEIDPGANHPQYSLAVAVIDKSEPHYHRNTVEIYRILKGQLKLYVNNEEHLMFEGQEYTVVPGTVHWAEGDETWVEVYTNPAWSPDDHHLCPANE